MRDVLVTVVIPVFNRASKIEVALRSIQTQSCPDWEAIVVDDGSEDGTDNVVVGLLKEDDRIELKRHNRNLGAQAARNTGIRCARGTWIAFLDSDDQWLQDSLSLRLDAARKHQIEVVHSAAYRILEDGDTVLHEIPPLEGWVYPALLQTPGPMFQGLLVTRSALERIGGLDERILALQEWDTAIRLAKEYRFGFVASPTFIWDCRGTDTITKDRRRDARGYEQVVRKHRRSMVRHGGFQTVALHYRKLTRWYGSVGDYSSLFRSGFLYASCCVLAHSRVHRTEH